MLSRTVVDEAVQLRMRRREFGHKALDVGGARHVADVQVDALVARFGDDLSASLFAALDVSADHVDAGGLSKGGGGGEYIPPRFAISMAVAFPRPEFAP
jgi:hypothetical protein